MTMPTGLLAYATYLPRHRLDPAEPAAALGAQAGRGERVAACYDEDSTTMAVEAASTLLGTSARQPATLYLATTSPAYLDKTNACAVHAALGLPSTMFAADLVGAPRSGIAAWRAAAASGGMAVVSDVRTGRAGSEDERDGGDGAAAFLFGPVDEAIAEIVAEHSTSVEILDRWRLPSETTCDHWEERFGVETMLPAARAAITAVLSSAGLERVDHAVVVSPNRALARAAARLAPGGTVTGSPIGHAGCADFGLGLADILDRADAGRTILVLSLADGCDAMVLRTTDELIRRRPPAVSVQLAAGMPVPYTTYLTWRGRLEREAPRRPQPERPSAAASARATPWKFNFVASRCRPCGFVHLPPVRVCRRCASVDEMDTRALARVAGTIATYTVDRLAFSPSPPLIEAVVDFDGGGRYTLEVADARADDLAVGVPVDLSFRRLYTVGGVHNYFWKARLTACPTQTGAAS